MKHGSLHASRLRPQGPQFLRLRRVTPIALNCGIEAEGAVRAGSNARPEGKFGGTAGTLGASHWSAEKRSKQRSQQPKVEEKCCEVPEVLKCSRRVLGVEEDKRGGQSYYQKPPQLGGNAQLQLEVFPHAHNLMVTARALIRLLSRSGDMSQITGHRKRYTRRDSNGAIQ